MTFANTSLFNFRDLGGVAVGAGGSVVADRLFRSGHHADLSDDARDALLAYDFRVILDLRYPDERTKDVSPWPIAWVDRVLAHDTDRGRSAPHIALLAAANNGSNAVHSAYRDVYAAMPFDPILRQLFAEGISRLGETDGRMLIHCSAGKDRTGIFVALLLDLLGVPRDMIANDYLQSSHSPALHRIGEDLALRLTYDGNEDAAAVAAALVGVRADYLAAMFGAIDARYGGAEAYFRDDQLSFETIANVRARFVSR